MKRQMKKRVIEVDGEKVEVTRGSGNVFADLDLPDADNLLLKADLAIAARDAIRSRHLTQSKAATLMGFTQPKVHKVISGKLQGISVEKLMTGLAGLGMNVVVEILASATGAGSVSVRRRTSKRTVRAA